MLGLLGSNKHQMTSVNHHLKVRKAKYYYLDLIGIYNLGTCHYCRRDVGPDGVSAADKIYHRQCFKCFKCGDKLVVKFYVHQVSCQ